MAPVYHMKKHEGTVYSVQFSPHNQHIFASGGSDKVIKLWDVRNLSESLYDFIEPSCQ
jgi:histone-binding protein RBBP4